MSSSQELPVDRLASLDQEGHRLFIYPADVSGKYRTRRHWLNAILIVFFLVLPWIQINGHQAVWLDIARRRFSIFGILFWAHDAPMLFFLFGGAAISLAFVTAIWGRVWCGWACPQTVFIDGVFRRIERWIEGDAVNRRKLAEGPWTSDKIAKTGLKWSVYTFASLIITHSFLAYFVGTGPLLKMISRTPAENPGDFIFILVTTGLVLFDFGWFREQFCTIVCPYGRFQSVLMDDRSLVVAYDARRGEPRRGGAPSPGQPQGDCVNCYRCVKVCPTGVDIRRGTQLECIACSACADACDEVMTRLKKPKGLIRYDSLQKIQGMPATGSPWIRPALYGTILTVMFSGLAWIVHNRVDLSAVVIRAIDTPYQQVVGANGAPEILNHFKVHLENQSFEDQEIRIDVPASLKAAGVSVVLSNHKDTLPAGAAERADLFVRFPPSLLKHGKGTLSVEISGKTLQKGETTELKKEAVLVGPSR